MSREIYISTFANFGIQVRFRDVAHDDWDYVRRHLASQSVMESDFNISYQKSYYANFSQDDLSIVFYKKNGEPCGITPVLLREVENQRFLGLPSTAGFSLEPIQFVKNLSSTECKRISKSFLKSLKSYTSLQNIDEFKCHAYSEKMTDSINGWHSSCAELADSMSVNYEAYVNLTHDLDSIRVGFRKSYKPLINRANRIWSSRILGSDEICESDWDEFKLLHFKAAGNQKTRSDDSWNLQFLQIMKKNAFFIALYDDDGKMVGGGLFSHTRDQGVYSVGAYDRSQFDKPLGHLVQWLAIKELKRLGVKSYLIGDRRYLSEIPKPTEKEFNIGLFKEGFCTAIRPRFVFHFSTI